MSITSTDAAARGISHDGVPTTFPAGSLLRYYTGAPPGANAAATGTKLAEITLPATPWGAAASRGTPKSGTWSTAGLAAGNAGYARIVTAGDTNAATQNEPRIEGTVTATGGGGDFTLDNISIAVGQTVTQNSLAVSL
ncbi:MAG: hypothetical protein HOQ34_10250 [Gemmatimonadaceae bacterium]|nr:hypothetical protein [Gemmatimonadaceae bacterium]